MTKSQKVQAFTLELCQFEVGSPNAKFADRIANYARYVPNTELTNHDAKELARLFDLYVGESLKEQVDALNSERNNG